jgi:hypothetical protein
MTGAAIVRTRRGRVYRGTASIRDGILSMPDARLLHRDARGTRYYDPCARSWSPREWIEVRWIATHADLEAVA